MQNDVSKDLRYSGISLNLQCTIDLEVFCEFYFGGIQQLNTSFLSWLTMLRVEAELYLQVWITTGYEASCAEGFTESYLKSCLWSVIQLLYLENSV